MLKAGDAIGDWRVVRPLAEGGMGSVFRCQNALSERIEAAVKVVKPHELGEARQRFIQEVEALFTIRHPAIVRVTGWGEDTERGLLWLAMELVDGVELAERLKAGPLSEAEATPLFAEVAAGLRAAHAKGICHRDLKPANIMITSEGEGRLLDFGIAVADGKDRHTSTGLVAGTLAYLPPEHFEDEGIDPRLGDIYSLGLVMYEALTGASPFPHDATLSGGQQMARVMKRKLELEELDPGEAFSPALRAAVRGATRADPKARTQDIGALAAALGAPEGPTAALRPLPVGVQSTSTPAPLGTGAPAPQRTGVQTSTLVKGGVALAAGGLGAGALAAVVAAVLVVLLLLGGGLWLSTRFPPPPAPTVAAAGPAAAPQPLPAPALDAPAKPTPPAPPPKAAPAAATPAAPVETPASDQPNAPTVKPDAPTSKPEAPAAKPAPTPAPAPAPREPAARSVPLTFMSAPLGAAVFIDSQRIGKTPLTKHQVPVGPHTVKMVLDGKSIQRNITANAKSPSRYLWLGGDRWQAMD